MFFVPSPLRKAYQEASDVSRESVFIIIHGFQECQAVSNASCGKRTPVLLCKEDELKEPREAPEEKRTEETPGMRITKSRQEREQQKSRWERKEQRNGL